ncbi:YwqG family protein [Neptuniibacter sp. QD34_54]|uniref:YwqG family protein n=1 Tax=Neptuniibacter sp. QD34_54 TaxID=3398208 RepID=UPI0039F4EB52
MDIETQAQAIRASLQQYALPTVKLSPIAEHAKHVWSSKFGGKAYWPKCMDYPKSKAGEKLVLLAQLNFAELPNIDGYPVSGLLQFFIEDDDLYGMDFDNPIEEVINSPSGYRVVYHSVIEMNTELLESDLPTPHKDSYLPLTREFRVEGRVESEIPSPTDFRFEKYACDPFDYEEDLGEYIYDNFSSEGSKVGGYACFTQEDPRKLGTDGRWVLLFQMDSESVGDHEIMWGDMGVGNFFIEEEALKQNDFSKVWYNWDCS